MLVAQCFPKVIAGQGGRGGPRTVVEIGVIRRVLVDPFGVRADPCEAVGVLHGTREERENLFFVRQTPPESRRAPRPKCGRIGSFC